MTIADITTTDTGGQSFKLARAISDYTEHVSRSFITELDYIKYPYDIIRTEINKEFVSNYLQNVDVIHLHKKYRYLNGWGELNKNAKLIIHQHGRFSTETDWNKIRESDKTRKAFRIVSTINLLKYVDFDINRWFPAPFRLVEFDILKEKYYKQTDKIRIAHSPTNRDYKNTDLLISICNKISDVELILIEGKTNEETLQQRATCDITYDQMHLCYGNSGLEGMCFSQPTIVGMPDETRNLIKEHIGDEPYVFATPETLEQIILELVSNEGMRKFYGTKARNYIDKWHDDKKVTERIIGIYEKL